MVDGYPTGSIRVSLGYMSRRKDAEKLIEMIETCFVTQPAIKKIPPKEYNSYLIPTDNQFKNNFEDSDNNSEGILKQIILYPIKSCAGFSVKEWPLTSTGLKFDRQWMVINSSGVAVTQKNSKKMCLIRPIVDLETETLFLTYPGLLLLTLMYFFCKCFFRSQKLARSDKCWFVFAKCRVSLSK